MIETLSFYLRLALYVVPAVVVFHFVAGMATIQAIVLGLCIGWVFFAIALAASFKPYQVQVFVNYEALRNDLGFTLEHSPAEKVYVLEPVS